MKASRLLAGFLIALPGVARAQDGRAASQGGVADLLTISSTAPRLIRCTEYNTSFNVSCFRMLFEIQTAVPSRKVDIGVPRAGQSDEILGMAALSQTGATCRSKWLAGIPLTDQVFRRQFYWYDARPPFRVGANKPGTLAVEFACDGRLVPGDGVRVTIILAIDPDGRSIQMGQYVVTDAKIREAR